MSDSCLLAYMLKIDVSNGCTFNPLTAKLFNSGNNLSGVAVQFATQFWANAMQ